MKLLGVFGAMTPAMALLTAPELRAQNLGMVELPSYLAESGTQVEGVLNRDPKTNAFLGFCEGPAVDAVGNAFFSNAGRILKVTPEGKGSIFDAAAAGTNGLEFDPQGRLVSCQGGKLVRYAADGSKESLLSEGGGTSFGSINDLSISSSGAMMFTNFSGGRVFWKGAGDATPASHTVGGNPNGVEWLEEKQFAYLNLAAADKILKVRFDPASTSPFPTQVAAATEFVTGIDGPDGLTVDALGNVYVSANRWGTIQVYDSLGASLGRITVLSANPQQTGKTYNTTNCTFGGPDNRTLYITGNDGLYKVRLKIPGRRRPGTTSLAELRSSKRIGLTLSSRLFDPRRGPLRIRFSDPFGGASLAVYDISMRRLLTMPAPQDSEASWDGNGMDGAALPPGSYFVAFSRYGRLIEAQPVSLLFH